MDKRLKEQIERRTKPVNEFVQNKNFEKLQELHSDILTTVGLAIGPLNPITAPFVISTLEMYKRSVSKAFPESVSLANRILEESDVDEVAFKMPFNAGGDNC